MQDAPFRKELLERIEKIRKHATARPDLLGFEQAHQRGNISEKELNAAKAKQARVDRTIGLETAQIEALAVRYPNPFNRFLDGTVAKLEHIAAQLDADSNVSEAFDKRYTRSLLPDLIAGLKARRSRRELRHPLPWLLWVSVDMLRTMAKQLGTADSLSPDED